MDEQKSSVEMHSSDKRKLCLHNKINKIISLKFLK